LDKFAGVVAGEAMHAPSARHCEAWSDPCPGVNAAGTNLRVVE